MLSLKYFTLSLYSLSLAAGFNFRVNPLIGKPSFANTRSYTRSMEYMKMEVSFSDAKSKKVIVFGGDGFCGWPTALYLSDQGHDVTIVDNLSRRKIDIELGCEKSITTSLS